LSASRAAAPAGPGRAALSAALLGLLLGTAACSPIYVARAGWAQARILASREPLVEVMTDAATDVRTRGKLRLVHDAREFAIQDLGFRNVGDSYATLARLRSDTLALVLSAAYRDRLAFRTWWFPITGRVPYRAYFSEGAAERARAALEAEGFDTYVRPTAAFSTLGWFADPLYSTLLRLDEVGLVETVLHELSHNHLFLPGQARFNESFANFAGHAASIEFFCRREGGGPDTVKCRRAHDRWADARDVSRYLMAVEADIRRVYALDDLSIEERIRRRSVVYAEALRSFREAVQPALRATTYAHLADQELNNATLLSRTLYFHRLEDFHLLWMEGWHGDLAGLLAWLRREAPGRVDALELLDLSEAPH
jgi:predicted aminopeptidase